VGWDVPLVGRWADLYNFLEAVKLSDLKRFYTLAKGNQCLTVYLISCNCLYIKPIAPASPASVEKMENIMYDIDENFPGLKYDHRPGNMLRVEVKR
jgi:hypothetical protein